MNRLNNIKELAEESLKKWNNGYAKVSGKCAFCWDAINTSHNVPAGYFEYCELCLCPPSLCDNYSTEGLIYDIKIIYAVNGITLYIKNADPSMVKLMKDALGLLAKVGYIDGLIGDVDE